MCELEVFADPTPTLEVVSQGKPTEQSSMAYGGASARAADGNTATSWGGGSCTHTTTEANPWWRVDLEAVKSVHEVKLFNRNKYQER